MWNAGFYSRASKAGAKRDCASSRTTHNDQAPYGYVQPAPVYLQSQPVFVQPQPVSYETHRSYQRLSPWGDAARDGLLNRYDRAPNDPYRR